MKKRLLITSIVMMLVVAVALSTATYAWFTSNATVQASSINMTAATSDAPSIGIAWTNENYGTSISATGPTNDARFAPMIPSAITAGTTYVTAATAAGGVDFYSATIKDTPAKFNNDVKHWGAEQAVNQVAPYVWTNGTQTTFFVKNQSEVNNLAHVTLTATIDGVGADLIRVAVFARIGSTANDEPSGNYVLKKILSNVYTYTAATTFAANTKYYTKAQDGTEISTITNQETLDSYNATEGQQAYTRTVAAAANTAYATSGSISADDVVSTAVSQNSTDNAMNVDLGALNANCIAELIVYVWTDGTALNDNRAGQAASIKLDFAASRS